MKNLNKKNSFVESPARAFPADMKGMTYRVQHLDERYRFFEVYAIRYSAEEINRLEEMDCLAESEIGRYLELTAGAEITLNTLYLYKLETYLANSSLTDVWEFNASISDYQEIVFTSYEQLLNHCLMRWNVHLSDFF